MEPSFSKGQPRTERIGPGLLLQINLLGPFQILLDGRSVPAKVWDRRQTPSLLKLLLTAPGKAFSSQEIIDHLWPTLTPEAAAKSLRATVSKLRKVLEPDLLQGRLSKYIETGAAGYTWVGSASVLDTDAVRAALEEGKANRQAHRWEEARADYQRALSYFRGEFLSDEPESDWTVAPRQHWRAVQQALLFSKGECHLSLGQYASAIESFQAMVEKDRCHEEAYRQLMLCHYLSGHFNEVALLFRQCGQAMKEELGVEPSEETARLYEQILRRRVPGIDKTPRSPLPIKKPPYSLGRMAFIGRKEEVGVIASYIEEALNRKGGIIALGGAPGIGKTRLAEEMLLYARSRSCLTAGGRCYSPQWRRPYEPFAEIFRQILKGPGRDALLALSPFWLACASQIVPELAAPKDGPIPPAVPLDQEKQRLFEAVIRLLIDFSIQHPLVLLFDDLHWADDETLQLLHYFVHQISSEPILILMTYRAEEGASNRFLVQLLTALQRLSSRNLVLPELPTESLLTLFRKMSPKEQLPPGMEQLALRIHREAQGNPLFMVELLQSLLEKGIFKVNNRGKWIDTQEEGKSVASHHWEIPRGIRQVIRSRLERIAPDRKLALEMISTLSQGFSQHFLEKVLEGEKGSASEILDALMRLGFVQEEPQVKGIYRFAHENIRQTIYETLTSGRKKDFHLRIGETLETLGGADRPLQALAHHFFMAEAWSRAYPYTMQAAEGAQRTYAFGSALLLLDQAEQILTLHGAGFLIPSDLLREKLRLLQIKDHVLDGQGDLKKREKVVAERVRLARSLSDPVELASAYLALCGLHEASRGWSEASDLAKQALALYETEKDRGGMARGYRELGYIYWQSNQFEKALVANQKALALHEETENVSGVAGDLHNLGQVYTSMGDFEKGLEYYRKARSAFEKVGGHQSRTLNIFSRIARLTGNLDDALSSTLQAIESAHEVGHHFGEWHYLMNAASLWFTMGKRDRALEAYRSSIEAIKKTGGNPGCIGHSLRGMGIVYKEEGSADQAAACFTDAAALLLESGELPAWAEVCRRLGELMMEAFQQGEKALHYYRSALSHYRKEGPSEAIAPLLNRIGYAAWSCGRSEEAIPFYLEALESAREKGDRAMIGATLAQLGVVYRETGRFQKSLECTLQAQLVAQSLADRAAEGYIASSLCETYLSLGKLPEAEAAARAALALRSGSRSDFGAAQEDPWAHFRLGKVLLRGKKKSEGRLHLDRAQSLAETSGDRALLEEIAALKSKA
ncbi:MAG: tetratricopeptide repeat protein [Nitrospirae bacterium]|nr:tetratricopeptide repeat protein [Candidatus Manganitrophaceae bacterium]